MERPPLRISPFPTMVCMERACFIGAILILASGAAAHSQVIATLKGHKHTITSLAWAPDGKTLASGAKDETVILWDLADMKPRATLGGHKDMVITVPLFARFQDCCQRQPR